jgi:hypothetical protein
MFFFSYYSSYSLKTEVNLDFINNISYADLTRVISKIMFFLQNNSTKQKKKELTTR